MYNQRFFQIFKLERPLIWYQHSLYKEKEHSTCDDVIGANLKYVTLLPVKSSGISKPTFSFSPFNIFEIIQITLNPLLLFRTVCNFLLITVPAVPVVWLNFVETPCAISIASDKEISCFCRRVIATGSYYISHLYNR